MTPAVQVTDLRVDTQHADPIVEGITFQLAPGQLLALIGESGSGKTTTALALLGWGNPGTVISGGEVRIAGESMLGRGDAELRGLRARLISYVPQDPLRALNPALRIGRQLDEILRAHRVSQGRERMIAQALQRARLPADRGFLRRFPHQLSGGQRQRVVIAQALLLEPAVVVLDEPTTGLDPVTRREFVGHLDQLRAETGAAMVYVTHDIATIAPIADQVAVLYAGSIVEEGPAAWVLDQPRHHYTRGLLDAVPDPDRPARPRGIPGKLPPVGARPPGCRFAPRCSHVRSECRTAPTQLQAIGPGHRVRCHHPSGNRRTLPELTPPALPTAPAVLLQVRRLRASHRSSHNRVIAAVDVDLDLAEGSCLALVGESGSGKTTIGRCLAGLHTPDAGTLTLDGQPMAGAARRRTREQRRRVQMVFQSPAESLNPRRTIGAEIARVLRFFDTLADRPIDQRVAELLDSVRLPTTLANRYPGQLSGGEQQRAAIARALAAEPSVLICDEITSALDVSVQAAVLGLLHDLQHELRLAVLFISHDLGAVAAVADQIAVLHHGRIHARRGRLLRCSQPL